MNTGDWDQECKSRVTDLLEQDGAPGALTLMMFGGVYLTEFEAVAQIVDIDEYVRAVRTLAAASSTLDESVKNAAVKAVKEIERKR